MYWAFHTSERWVEIWVNFVYITTICVCSSARPYLKKKGSYTACCCYYLCSCQCHYDVLYVHVRPAHTHCYMGVGATRHIVTILLSFFFFFRYGQKLLRNLSSNKSIVRLCLRCALPLSFLWNEKKRDSVYSSRPSNGGTFAKRNMRCAKEMRCCPP